MGQAPLITLLDEVGTPQITINQWAEQKH